MEHEQQDELVLDFDDDLLDTSTSSALVGDSEESAAPPTGEDDDGLAAHEKDAEYDRQNDQSASDENALDQSFEIDEMKGDDGTEELVDEDHDDQRDDSLLYDEKRALIEEVVEKEIRRTVYASEPQESASDDDGSSESGESDDSSGSSSDSQATSSDEEADESPDNAKHSPAPKKASSRERRNERSERPDSNQRKRRRPATRSASPPRQHQASLRVVVNEDRGRRVHQSHNDHHGAVDNNKKSKRLCADSYTVNTVLEDAKFYLIKSANMENVQISKNLNVWATTKFNDKMLSENFHRVKNVILIFSVEKSGAFQGFARLHSASLRDHKPVNWVLPPNFPANRLGGIFRLKWITRQELPFTSAAHLHNPLNEDKPIKVGRDGTEIQSAVARRLCGMFPMDDGIDLAKVAGAGSAGGATSSSTSRERRRQSPPSSSSSSRKKSRQQRSRSKEDRIKSSSRRGRDDRRSRERKSGSNCEPLGGSGGMGGMSSVVSVPRRQHRDSYPPMQPSGYPSFIDPYSSAMQLMSQQQMYHANAGGGAMSMMPHFAYMSHHKFPAVVPAPADYGLSTYHRDDRRPPPPMPRRKRSVSPYASNADDYRRYRTTSDGRSRPSQSSSSSRDRRRSPPPRQRTSSRR